MLISLTRDIVKKRAPEKKYGCKRKNDELNLPVDG
jgi:hypothetical protein